MRLRFNQENNSQRHFPSRTLLALAGLAPLFNLGCSSLLYYPSSQFFVAPSKIPYRPEELKIQTEDGLDLVAWSFRAPRPKKDAPLLLFFHGNAQNVSAHFVGLYWILDHGYDFTILDYRGYGGSEGDPSPQGTVQDGSAFFRWAEAKYPRRPKVIFAQSLGGAIALRALSENRSWFHPQLIVIEASFKSYRAAGVSALAKSAWTWPFQWLAHLVLSDAHAPNEERIRSLSPTPIIVVHSKDDPVIDLRLGKDLFEAAGEPKEFWETTGDHINAFQGKDSTLRRRLLERLAKPPLPHPQ